MIWVTATAGEAARRRVFQSRYAGALAQGFALQETALAQR
jgi:hypothetical protein